MKNIILILILSLFFIPNLAIGQKEITKEEQTKSEEELFILVNQYRTARGLSPFLEGNTLGNILTLEASEKVAEVLIDFKIEIEKKFNFFLKKNDVYNAINYTNLYIKQKYNCSTSLTEKEIKDIAQGLEYYTRYSKQKKYEKYKDILISYWVSSLFVHFKIGHINFDQRRSKMIEAGYTVVAENAMFSGANPTGERLFKGYKNSPEHNKNLLIHVSNARSYYVNIVTMQINYKYYYNIMFIYGK